MTTDHLPGTIACPVDAKTAQALREGALMRQIGHTHAPTPQQREEIDRAVKSHNFEHGDHQPDGTVLPPGKYPYRLHYADGVLRGGYSLATDTRKNHG